MDWQTIVSLGIVAFAAMILFRQLFPRRSQGGHGCSSGCGGCPSSPANVGNGTLVTLEPFPRRDN